MTIRPATHDDLHDLVEMAALMHAEAPQYRDEPFISGDMRDFLNHSLEDPDKCIMVSEDAGRITGMIGGGLVPWMFNFSRGYATDFGIYVHPDYRGGLTGLRLIRWLECWAHERGVYTVKIGESTGIAPEIFGRLLRKIGYNHSGACYTKILSPENQDMEVR